METSKEQAHRAWRSAERIKRLSDRVVGVGPIGVGLDGVLAWIPGAGTLYSLGAGGLLMYEGYRAGVSARTLVKMGAYLALDSAASVPPVIGWAIDTLFPGHLMAAKALQKDVEARHGPAEPRGGWLRRPPPSMRNVTPRGVR
jgi:hypothetical protein